MKKNRFSFSVCNSSREILVVVPHDEVYDAPYGNGASRFELDGLLIILGLGKRLTNYRSYLKTFAETFRA